MDGATGTTGAAAGGTSTVGMRIFVAHFGHSPSLPAVESGTLMLAVQYGQWKRMAMCPLGRNVLWRFSQSKAFSLSVRAFDQICASG